MRAFWGAAACVIIGKILLEFQDSISGAGDAFSASVHFGGLGAVLRQGLAQRERLG
jgi:hypothetical protein